MATSKLLISKLVLQCRQITLSRKGRGLRTSALSGIKWGVVTVIDRSVVAIDQ